MALEIKVVPTLSGCAAEHFEKAAKKASQNRKREDYSKQVKVAHAILRKAKML